MRENFSDIGRLVSRLPGAREKSLGPSAKGLGRALETQDGRQCLSQKQVWLFIFWTTTTSTDFHTNLTLILDFRHLFNTGNPECFSMREIFVAHAGESIFWLPCGRVPHNAGELACIHSPINFGWAGQNVWFTFVRKGHWRALKPTVRTNTTCSSGYCWCITSCCYPNVNLPKSVIVYTSVNKCHARIILTVGHALFPNHLVLSATWTWCN